MFDDKYRTSSKDKIDNLLSCEPTAALSKDLQQTHTANALDYLQHSFDKIDQTEQCKSEEQDKLPQCLQFPSLYDPKYNKPHMTLAKYAQRRRLHCELHATDKSIVSPMVQQYSMVKRREFSTSSDDTHDRHVMILTTDVQCQCCDRQEGEMSQRSLLTAEQQRNLFRHRKFATSPADGHREEFVTLNRYIELKALDPIWFEIDRSVISSRAPQNSLRTTSACTTAFNNEHEIQVIRMAEHMRQKFLYEKLHQMSEPMSSPTEQQDNWPTTVQTNIASDNKCEKRCLMTLGEYAERRRLRHEQRKKNQVAESSSSSSSSRGQSITSSDDEHQDDYVTLARYIELKGLDPESFETNESMPSPVEHQDTPPGHYRQIVSSDDKQEILDINEDDYIMRESLACRIELNHSRLGTDLKAKHENDQPIKAMSGLLTCMGRHMFGCFRQSSMPTTPIINHRKIA